MLRYDIEQLPLLPATYLVTTAVHDSRSHQCYDYHMKAYSFRVRQNEIKEMEGLVALPANWSIKTLEPTIQN